MFWCDKLTADLKGPQIINDSKTPSGKPHVGALRGPLIHDAIFRTLQDQGIPVRYLFGCDDFDPVDEIPYGENEHFKQYLGAPLCNVPPPPGSSATDMAEHYIGDFWNVFEELEIQPEIYRMRDIYRTGKFNEEIDIILCKADTVRRIYKDVSGGERPETWHPFQVICEDCGRIGTTEVTAYDGKEVTYECKPNMVQWAEGCGYKGKISPFNGNGKLPWKLEWCAKWRNFLVTIEGAGQDHSTKHGSRDVASACLRAIFDQPPPLNCPYSFFLVGGAKMSSSKGVGISSREMADFLPPDVLRFLMIRTPPKKHVNFDCSEAHIVKVFNEYDRLQSSYYKNSNTSSTNKRIFELSHVVHKTNHWVADFQLVTALVQMPHLDPIKELELRKGSTFSDIELINLKLRIRAAEYWIKNFATEDEKTILQENIPVSVGELSATQRAFLCKLGTILESVKWEEEVLQVSIFNAARLTPVDQPSAFRAIYRVLFNRENGPKAGNFLSFIDRDFVIRRFSELPFDKLKFWKETGISTEAFEGWLEKDKSKILTISARLDFLSIGRDLLPNSSGNQHQQGLGIINFIYTKSDEKSYCMRVIFEKFETIGTSGENELELFSLYANEWVMEVSKKSNVSIRMQPLCLE